MGNYDLGGSLNVLVKLKTWQGIMCQNIKDDTIFNEYINKIHLTNFLVFPDSRSRPKLLSCFVWFLGSGNSWFSVFFFKSRCATIRRGKSFIISVSWNNKCNKNTKYISMNGKL